jgi:hypothetical protein
MKLKIFLRYFTWGIVGVLNSFGHVQNPSNNIDPWCLIIKYPNEGIGFLVGFGKVTYTPSRFKRYVMEPNVFLGYPKRGITCSLNLFRHEQYLSNSLNQNNSTHGVYSVYQ